MKKINRIISVLLLLCLVAGLLMGCGSQGISLWKPEEIMDFANGFSFAEDAKNELVKVSENKRFTLLANFNRGTVAVEDKRTGITWYSNPEDLSNDVLASGFNKNALQSAITMVYTTEHGVEMTCGGFMSSVRKEGLFYRVEDDGSVLFFFDFPNEMISIPVLFSINEDSFNAKVIAHGIREYGTNVIKSIDLLPFFGAAGREQEGYMLVPDGSGALIYYNNNRLTAKTYSKPLYGFDNGTSDKLMGGAASSAYFTLSENQQLPVFGSSSSQKGFLAVIEGGAARAGINANVAGKYTLYNTVWPTYYYHTIGTVNQTQKDGSETTTKVAEKHTETWEDFSVSYRFLEEGKTSYADMAALYRQYLINYKGLTSRVAAQDSIPLYLDLYGYIQKTKSLLGLPVETKISMTTVEDVNAMLDTLAEDGVSNVVLKYNYWAKNSYFGKIPTKASVDPKVGTQKELLALQQRLEEAGGKLYLGADLVNVYKTGRGINQYGGVLRNVANTTQRQYQFSLSSAQVDSRYDPWYLLRPSKLRQMFDTFSANMDKAGFYNLALDSIGAMLYSELNKDGVGRNQMRQIVAQALAAVDQRAEGLMFQAANDYAAVLASHILQAPSKSSNYDLQDESVPFYQMVFHGYVSYSLDPINLASNPADTTLRHLEFGAYPMYSLISRNADELIGSRMDRLYSADAANWLSFAAKQHAQLNEALSQVQDSTMTGHEILSSNVRRVTYSNGIQIYINYGAAAETVSGICLEAKGYAVVSGSQVLCSGQAAGK